MLIESFTFVVILGVGSLLFALILIFCVGASMGNHIFAKCIFSVPLVYLFLLMVLQLGFAIFLHIHQKDVKQQVQEEFKSLWDKREFSNNIKTINYIQQNLKCCGFDSYQDYKTEVPNSCCEKGVKTCYSFLYFTKGCKQELVHVSSGVFCAMEIICFALAFVEVFILFWVCYAKSLKPSCHESHV
jgi:D-Tyr-tRNAtyr deacylase